MVKLDVTLLKYMSKEEFRVLTAVRVIFCRGLQSICIDCVAPYLWVDIDEKLLFVISIRLLFYSVNN